MTRVGKQGKTLRTLGVALLTLGLFAGLPGAWGQGTTVGGGDSPIEVFSDNGIEWRRDEMMYVARGNAIAIQDQDRVMGDVLVAHYRETEDGGTEIWRMESLGNARIETPDQTVTGGNAAYEKDSGILVVRGAPLQMVTDTETVTAKESLEYWSRERMAVARGDARVVRANGDTVDADIVTGYFADEEDDAEEVVTADTAPSEPAAEAGTESTDGRGGMDRMEAFGDVVITTAKEVVRGDRAVYDVPAEIATVYGNVTVSTETDQFAGNRAVMNLKTGVSTLYGGGDDDGRARALIVPQRPEENAGEGGATSDAPTDTN
jgi:lipopolysaccharide export system protein LptA